MKVTALRKDLIPSVRQLMSLGEPYIRARTYSDYWLYAQLFSSSCPVALIDGAVIGAVMAFRSQDEPDDVYIQDVMTHPDYRGQGIARTLLDAVRARAAAWGCARMYLTSEPENITAYATWKALGYVNLPGDYVVDRVSVMSEFKGPGRDRSVYQLDLRPALRRWRQFRW